MREAEHLHMHGEVQEKAQLSTCKCQAVPSLYSILATSQYQTKASWL